MGKSRQKIREMCDDGPFLGVDVWPYNRPFLFRGANGVETVFEWLMVRTWVGNDMILGERKGHKMNRNDVEKAIEAMQGWLDGKQIEIRERDSGDGWGLLGTNTQIKWMFHHLEYRIAALSPDSLDWTHVADDYICHARDADGEVYLWTGIPYKGNSAWSAKSGHTCRIKPAKGPATLASFKQGTCDWEDSLVMRPGVTS